MIIKTDLGVFIDINDKKFIVKDKKLYNTETERFEGVDGDYVYFTTFMKTSGSKVITSGSVDGYTNGNRVKLKGVSKTYDSVIDVNIEHFRSVDVYTDENAIKIEPIFVD